MALLGWVAGCTMIWSALFAVGNYLYGRMPAMWLLLVVFAISGSVLVYVTRQLWSDGPVSLENPLPDGPTR
jgi:hypothetical protein